jgi:RNA polymerase sigma-70 factor (ECF subfamily)
MKTPPEIIAMLKDPAQRERGFSVLVQRFSQPLYWHARSMVVSHDWADDVVQNTFIKVWQNLGQFRFDSDPYTWMYRICTREALNLLRREKNTAPLTVVNEAEDLGGLSGDEMALLLKQALDTLPERQRMVFELRYYQEMPYQTMAEMLNLSEGALKASYHHAVKKIELFLTRR